MTPETNHKAADVQPVAAEAETEEVSAPAAPAEAEVEAAAAAPADAGAEAPAAAPAAVDEAAEPEAPPAEDAAAKYLELARRTQADFDNYRKRMARENAAAAQRGAAKLAKELLPAIDHLELALKATEGGHADVVRGFALVRDELVAALQRVGIERISPEGQPFDPNEHEAMAQHPVEDAEPGTVIEVYQQGYRHDGTVLRPARVVVAQ
jgi:molecular chaperone GrpE